MVASTTRWQWDEILMIQASNPLHLIWSSYASNSLLNCFIYVAEKWGFVKRTGAGLANLG